MVSLGKLDNIFTKNLFGNPVPVHLASWNFMDISPIGILLLTNLQHNLAPEGTECSQGLVVSIFLSVIYLGKQESSSPQDPTLLYFIYTVTHRPYLSPSLHLAYFSDFVWEEVSHSHWTTPTSMTSGHPNLISVCIYIFIYMKVYAKVCIKVYMNVEIYISHTGSKNCSDWQINIQTQLCYNYNTYIQL